MQIHIPMSECIVNLLFHMCSWNQKCLAAKVRFIFFFESYLMSLLNSLTSGVGCFETPKWTTMHYTIVVIVASLLDSVPLFKVI